MGIDVNRERAIDLAVSQIEKQFGKGAIMKLGETVVRDLSTVSTGSIGLDLALGVGGVPRGRVVEIYGPESSGKTTLALHIIAEAQRLGGIGAFIDAEHALDMKYAGLLGVKSEDLLISQPDHGEQALEIADTLVRSGAIDVLVIDSVAALVPRAELEGDMGDPQMGLQARLMSQALRKLTANISKSNTILIFITPPLNGTAHGWHHNLESLRRQIIQGGPKYGGWMPAFGESLTAEQVDAVIAYFQSFWSDQIYTAWLKRNSKQSIDPPATEQAAEKAVQNNILIHLSRRLPNSKFGEPEETPLKGIFRLSMDDSIIYVSGDGRYVFLGDMVDLVEGRNITKTGIP